MNLLEEAIIYSTIMYQGKVRKINNSPYILHPLEVAQILSAMTNDIEIIAAGVLHDVVEDTDGTLKEIKKRFGQRVATLVDSETENDYPGEDKAATWQKRKEESLKKLKNSTDIGVKMLWLADKLSNMRSLAASYGEYGEKVWEFLHQKDSSNQLWYYKTIAEYVEMELNKTGCYKEYIDRINYIWPGTFDSSKAKYKEYRKISVDGCKCIGKGAKGDVYRYDDELVIKVYNHNNTYSDVEREIAMSRKAFILGMPTAISFGIVAVGERYGSMFELVESDTMSQYIARSPGQVDTYAKIMADLAKMIHSVEATEGDGFIQANERISGYIKGGIAYEDQSLADKCMKLIDELPVAGTLIHGDFHTGNVFLQKGEPLLIDMDRVSIGHPIIELSDLYYFYVLLGEDDPSVVEKFMGFSYKTSCDFFDLFLRYYLDTEDENKLREVKEKASLIGCSRMIRKIRKSSELSEHDSKLIEKYMKRLAELVSKLDSLSF